MTGLIHTTPCITVPEAVSLRLNNLLRILEDTRKVKIVSPDPVNWLHGHPTEPEARTILDEIEYLAHVLADAGHAAEAGALRDVRELATLSTDFGGLGLRPNGETLSEQDTSELLFLVSAHLEAVNSAERAKAPLKPLSQRPQGRRGMTLAEKVFAAHDIDQKGEVKPGDVIRVDVDWILASELSWKGMERWYDRLGQPGICRNDRFWLAGDHLVDPRIIDTPKIKSFVQSSERARKEFKMTDNQRMNYTIMHTEFCRERAQPGMLVIGSDSHTCSAGSVSCLAIGLGVADVILPLITGETWFKIPETVEIRFVNKPKPAISGKDVILYIFIGACTTTEELVLAALVLEQAMKLGAKPKRSGKRKVVPGSMPILHNLRKHGLIDIYERAGWEVGVPGCSYCVGMSADQAGKGETWLTSQNRNFENRMGPGAFGNLASAVTVAASSFDMKVTNPAPLLDFIDMARVDAILGRENNQETLIDPDFVEPGMKLSETRTLDPQPELPDLSFRGNREIHAAAAATVHMLC